MDKSTLSNYGWIIITVLVLAVMLALATPFGSYVGDAVVSVANGYVGASTDAIDDDNIENLQNKWENKLNNNNGNSSNGNSGNSDNDIEQDQAEEILNHNNVIPEGATYTTADGTVLNAGDSFPVTVANDDIYTYGDYKYTYLTSSNGWQVAINTNVTDTNQTSYGAILESINGQPVTSLDSTFIGCKNMTVAPKIPDSVTSIRMAFVNCTALTVAPAIPVGVTNMHQTFYRCSALTTAPVIPSSVDTMSDTFYYCTNLTTAPVIPSSVKYMLKTFRDCQSLTSITFEGTMAQWDAIAFTEDWNRNVPATYVQCSDGNVTL